MNCKYQQIMLNYLPTISSLPRTVAIPFEPPEFLPPLSMRMTTMVPSWAIGRPTLRVAHHRPDGLDRQRFSSSSTKNRNQSSLHSVGCFRVC